MRLIPVPLLRFATNRPEINLVNEIGRTEILSRSFRSHLVSGQATRLIVNQMQQSFGMHAIRYRLSSTARD